MSSPLPSNTFYVISYPRSGNTWLINCLTMLLDGVRGEAYTPFQLYTELHGSPDAGFHFWCEPRQRPDQPICVKSHDDLPSFRRRHPPGRIIYIARDARDSLLSYYFFQQAYAEREELSSTRIQGVDVLTSRGGADPVFRTDEFTRFLQREAPLWHSHVTSARSAPDICFLTYEELQRDFDATLQRALTHLGIPAAKSCEEVRRVYHTGFSAVFAGNNRDFFRRGQVGDWKNWFQPEHVRLVDALLGRDLVAMGFESDPDWATRHSFPSS